MSRPQFSLQALLWLVVVLAAFCAGTQLDRAYRADPMEAKVRAALQEKTDFKFVEKPLSGAVEWLAQHHGIDIELDNKALGDAGLPGNLPITRSAKDITLRSALNLLLSDLDLTYVVRDGVLMVTTKKVAQSTSQAVPATFRSNTVLWSVVAVGIFLGGIQVGRKWRRPSVAQE
ncbi:MAG TPA: hypothetical protein VHC22_00180 [Pirellulales bacterium]|nr:hypothetical protein [Pirellulales bacterium]